MRRKHSLARKGEVYNGHFESLNVADRGNTLFNLSNIGRSLSIYSEKYTGWSKEVYHLYHQKEKCDRS